MRHHNHHNHDMRRDGLPYDGEGRRRGRTPDGDDRFDGDFGEGRGRGRGRGRRGPGLGTGGMGRGPMGPGFEAGGPGFGPGFGPFGPMGPGGPRGRGRRARRGDVRHAILAVLSDGPSNGYGVIKSIEEHTGGVWRTSPGSVYPTLAQLADEGLISPVEGSTASGTEYELTEAGRTYVSEHAEELREGLGPSGAGVGRGR